MREGCKEGEGRREGRREGEGREGGRGKGGREVMIQDSTQINKQLSHLASVHTCYWRAGGVVHRQHSHNIFTSILRIRQCSELF